MTPETQRLLLHWRGRLHQRPGGAAEAAAISPEQCENMRALGYIDSCR